MQVLQRFKQGPGSPRSRILEQLSSILRGIPLLVIFGLALNLGAQTLARPGWAGSGMKVERWWPHAVLCGVEPGSLLTPGTSTESTTFHRLTERLNDLQALGIDAVLLGGLEAEAQSSTVAPTQQTTARPAIQVDPRYGTLDEFDDLVREAVRHGMRVLVELNPGAHGSALTVDARFWLNHGVTGVAVGTADPEVVRALRGVLHGYVGERVLISSGLVAASATSATPAPASSRERGAPRSATDSRSSEADLVRIPLPSTAAGPAPMRASLEQARAMLGIHGPMPLLGAETKNEVPAAQRALATALLGSGGAALLRVDDLDLEHASDPAGQSSVFAWYRQWSGLHRGNSVMRSGDETLLDHDADGALVWVRQRGIGAPAIVTICNMTDKPVRLSLVTDIERLHLRGSFLRTLARSDGGMGAMPLREVVLPPYAVYAGELSR